MDSCLRILFLRLLIIGDILVEFILLLLLIGLLSSFAFANNSSKDNVCGGCEEMDDIGAVPFAFANNSSKDNVCGGGCFVI